MAGQLLDDVFIVMANRQQAHIFVVEHFVFVMEFIDETFKNRFIIVDAKENVIAEFCIRLRRSLYLAKVAKIRLSFSSAIKENPGGKESVITDLLY